MSHSLLILALLTALPAGAAQAPSEQRLQALATELRCPVCQNQNLADSNADLATDLREEIRRQIAAGRSDAEIRRFMVARYGDFVLYDPPLQPSTLALWAGPFALLGLGGAALAWRLRRQQLALASSPVQPSLDTPEVLP